MVAPFILFFNDQIMQLNVNLWKKKTFCNRRNHEGCCDLSFFLCWLECTHKPLLFVIYKRQFTRDLHVKAETSVTETRHWPLNGTETPRPTFFIYLRWRPIRAGLVVSPNEYRNSWTQVDRRCVVVRHCEEDSIIQLLWSWLELLSLNSADIHASLDYCETIT